MVASVPLVPTFVRARAAKGYERRNRDTSDSACLRSLTTVPASVRPGIAAFESKIVGIGDDAACRRLGLRQLIRNSMALRIGDRFLLGVELEADLLAHVARAGPAHQRLDLTRLFRLVVEHPFLGLGRARLHRSL